MSARDSRRDTVWRVSGTLFGPKYYTSQAWAHSRFMRLKLAGDVNARMQYLTGEWKDANVNANVEA